MSSPTQVLSSKPAHTVVYSSSFLEKQKNFCAKLKKQTS